MTDILWDKLTNKTKAHACKKALLYNFADPSFK